MLASQARDRCKVPLLHRYGFSQIIQEVYNRHMDGVLYHHTRSFVRSSEQDFNSYIRFRIILFHISFAIFGLEFAHNIANSIAVCYWLASDACFCAAVYRNLQCLISQEVLVPVGVSALNWKQIQRVAFMHKPDWPRDISTRSSAFNTQCYLGHSIQSLVKVGFGHDNDINIPCSIYQIWVSHACCLLYPNTLLL
jgi:hypothetical protein